MSEAVQLVDNTGLTALHLAVMSGDNDTVECVGTSQDTHLDASDATGRTALHVAAGLGLNQILECLVVGRPRARPFVHLSKNLEPFVDNRT